MCMPEILNKFREEDNEPKNVTTLVREWGCSPTKPSAGTLVPHNEGGRPSHCDGSSREEHEEGQRQTLKNTRQQRNQGGLSDA
jgi:hypothetical protein